MSKSEEIRRRKALASADTVDLSGEGEPGEDSHLETMVRLVLPSSEPAIIVSRKIGDTGFSYVFEGQMAGREEMVAVKVMRYSEEGCPDIDSRRVRGFREEASVHRKILEHPRNSGRDGIVKVIHQGEIEGFYMTRNGYKALHYLVTELLEVNPLIDTLFDPKVKTAEKLGIIIRIAKSLEVAHHAGYTHVDVKLANTARCPRTGIIKILDLGNAKPTGSKLDGDYLIATTAYAAPETLDAGVVDERTDIFALGVILSEVFNYGKLPFEGTCRRNKPRRFTNHESIMLGIDDIAYKCLERDPGKRYPSMRELIGDLHSCML